MMCTILKQHWQKNEEEEGGGLSKGDIEFWDVLNSKKSDIVVYWYCIVELKFVFPVWKKTVSLFPLPTPTPSP